MGDSGEERGRVGKKGREWRIVGKKGERVGDSGTDAHYRSPLSQTVYM